MINSKACGGCEGTELITPQPTYNRPGLPQLACRIGTHAVFLETMKARLSGIEFPELDGLSTREGNDPSIALLDAWATVADVVSFYQERIANEGYLRTARERRSILELGRLVGYALRPGVSSSVFLGYTIEDTTKEEVVIPAGSRVQSVPGPDELPQTFETSEDLKARAEWNNLRPRMRQPQTAATIKDVAGNYLRPRLYLKGINTNLKPNDRLLIDFDAENTNVKPELFRVTEVAPDAKADRTLVILARPDYALLMVYSEDDNNHTFVVPFPAEDIIPTLQSGTGANTSTISITFFSNDTSTPSSVKFSVDEMIPFSAPNRSKLNLKKKEGVIPEYNNLKNVSFLTINFDTGDGAGVLGKFYIKRVSSGKDNHFALVMLTRPDYLDISLPEGSPTTINAGDALLIDFDAQGDNYQPERYLVKEISAGEGFPRTVRLQPENSGSSIPSIQLTHPISITFGTQEDAAIKVYTATDLKAEYLNDHNEVVFVLKKQDSANYVAASAASSSTGRLSIMRTPAIRSADIREVESFRGSLFQPILGSMKNILSIKKEPEELISPRASFSIEIASKVIAGHSESKKIAAIIDAEAESPRIVKAYALRANTSLFGHNASLRPEKDTSPSDWGEWGPDPSEAADLLYLDRAYDQILKGTYVAVVDEVEGDKIFEIKNCYSISRNAYGISSELLKMEIEPSGWWNPVIPPEENGANGDGNQDVTISKIRSTKVLAHQVELPLAEEPIESNISADSIAAANNFIELDGFYDGLRADQEVIISGELAALPGVPFSDLYRLNLIEQRGNPEIPGDKTHTFIQLNRKFTTAFKRDTVKIYGNVVKATHGETRQEVLGSGDSSKALQSFALKQKPLTFISAANPSGVESTLKVFVNDVRWHEAETLADREPTDRNFITKANNEDITNVQFGNGKKGMRLPTGLENIKAVYRSGMGKQGNVRAGQLSLLLDKPLGVKEVINPLRASGGVDREGCDQGRKNVPIAVKALDRLVSVQDYEDFSRTYTGIGKARAAELTDGRRQLVHVTIAGTDNIPIDEYSDLFLNLHRALHKFGDPHQPIHLAVRELMLMVISAEVRILPDYQWAPVEAQLRKTMLDTFSFERRELGQDVLLSEVFRAMQSVAGVEYVDVNTFGGIPEKIKGDNHGDERRPLLPDEIAYAVSCLSKQIKDGKAEELHLLTSDEIADAVWCNFNQWSKPANGMGAYCGKRGEGKGSAECAAYSNCEHIKNNLDKNETKKVRQRIEVNLAAFDNHMLRPAQLAFLTPDVPETLILNQI
jgi:hypothetical protein